MLSVAASENPSRSLTAIDEAGNRTEIARLSCTIKPESGYHLSVELYNADMVSANLPDVQAALDDFFADLCARLASAGLPVPGGDPDA